MQWELVDFTTGDMKEKDHVITSCEENVNNTHTVYGHVPGVLPLFIPRALASDRVSYQRSKSSSLLVAPSLALMTTVLQNCLWSLCRHSSNFRSLAHVLYVQCTCITFKLCCQYPYTHETVPAPLLSGRPYPVAIGVCELSCMPIHM